MPEDDVQNPALGGAGEATEPTEPEVQEPQAPVVKEPSGDPLDDIQDEAARADAKKWRAIARRTEGKPDAPVQAPSQPIAPGAKVVTTLAKQLVSDEVKEKWEELQTIPLGGFDATDPESIASNMTKRLVIWKAENQKDTSANSLSTSAVLGRSGQTPTEKKSILPRPLDVDAQAERLYGKS